MNAQLRGAIRSHQRGCRNEIERWPVVPCRIEFATERETLQLRQRFGNPATRHRFVIRRIAARGRSIGHDRSPFGPGHQAVRSCFHARPPASGVAATYPSSHVAVSQVFFCVGTFPPARRASDSPMAIACLRLVTFRPDPPLRSVHSCISCIVFSTLSWAVLPYLAMASPGRVCLGNTSRIAPCQLKRSSAMH